MDKRKDVENWCLDFDHSCILTDGWDDHILGIIDGVVAYSKKGIINSLMSDGMDYHEAEEFFSFNIEGAKGEGFPVYVDDMMLGEYEL